ncbi:unnamed protein product [Trichogramma brassicae]|uniref:Uncharacterized protein n=1 Tax=Trichogramma brassicae TaxID=86971 RepID=A0A6H5IWR7_9HYME|nr:unnamed protein product [Trichogramma brassicae]
MSSFNLQSRVFLRQTPPSISQTRLGISPKHACISYISRATATMNVRSYARLLSTSRGQGVACAARLFTHTYIRTHGYLYLVYTYTRTQASHDAGITVIIVQMSNWLHDTAMRGVWSYEDLLYPYSFQRTRYYGIGDTATIGEYHGARNDYDSPISKCELRPNGEKDYLTLFSKNSNDDKYYDKFALDFYEKCKVSIYYLNKNDTGLWSIRVLQEFENGTHKEFTEDYELFVKNGFLAEDAQKLDSGCGFKIKVTDDSAGTWTLIADINETVSYYSHKSVYVQNMENMKVKETLKYKIHLCTCVYNYPRNTTEAGSYVVVSSRSKAKSRSRSRSGGVIEFCNITIKVEFSKNVLTNIQTALQHPAAHAEERLANKNIIPSRRSQTERARSLLARCGYHDTDKPLLKIFKYKATHLPCDVLRMILGQEFYILITSTYIHFYFLYPTLRHIIQKGKILYFVHRNGAPIISLARYAFEYARRHGRKKKTINAEHVLQALEKLGFTDYCAEAEAVLRDCKAVAAKRRRQSTRLENLGIPEEELLRQQQELFAKAREEQAAADYQIQLAALAQIQAVQSTINPCPPSPPLLRIEESFSSYFTGFYCST